MAGKHQHGAIASLALAAASVSIVVACGDSRTPDKSPLSPGGSGAKAQVSQISTDPTVPAGEAWVMVDPRDSDKVMVIWLVTREPSRPDPEGAGYCGVARSFDGGKTWPEITQPFSPSDPPICGDPVGGIGPDGTVYLAADQIGADNYTPGLASSDFGTTWGPRTEIFGIHQMAAAAVANPGHRTPAIALGRDFMAVDQVTGEVSVHSQEDGGVEGRWLTVSSDKGKTWSVPRPLDPDIQSSSASPQSAAGGTIAVLYVVDPNSQNYQASPSPAVVCAEKCLVFETTTDKGVTWTRKTMPMPPPPGPAVGFAPYLVAADPSEPGHFAVLLLTNSSATLEFWVTPNSGTSWTRTKVLDVAEGDTVAKPWITYAANGTLGAVWRVVHADGSTVPSAMVSRDGGNTFSRAIPLVDKPTTPSSGVNPIGDDCACNLDLGDTYLSATWSDAVSGSKQMYYGRLDYTQLQ